MKLFNFKKIYILKNIVRDIFNKKQQKDFYKLENYKKKIKIDKKTVYKYFNYLFNSDSCIDFKKNFVINYCPSTHFLYFKPAKI